MSDCQRYLNIICWLIKDALPNNQYNFHEDNQQPFTLPFPTIHPQICTSQEITVTDDQIGPSIAERESGVQYVCQPGEKMTNLLFKV